MVNVARPNYRYVLQIATGDKAPYPEWLELRQTRGRPYRYIELVEAEMERDRMLKRQPHMKLRIAELP